MFLCIGPQFREAPFKKMPTAFWLFRGGEFSMLARLVWGTADKQHQNFQHQCSSDIQYWWDIQH